MAPGWVSCVGEGAFYASSSILAPKIRVFPFFFFYFRPIHYPRSALALPSPSSNPDPGSHSGASSPSPLRYASSFFIARVVQHFLPSSTRVELCLPTLLGALRFFCIFFFSHFYFPASGHAVVTGVVPFFPRFLPSIFIAHRVQQSRCSSIFHRVLLTHALALSASQFLHKKKSQRIFTSMHSAGLELTKLTYTRLEDNLIRHRGDRLSVYLGLADFFISFSLGSLCCSIQYTWYACRPVLVIACCRFAI